MHHDLTLLLNIAVVLCVAFVGGFVARRLRMPTLAGYLVAGLVIGPFTPGFVGDIADISQLAELGVIFMMFGVGLHFSLKDLWAVRGVAIPGATLQILTATALTVAVTTFWGWSLTAGLVVGLALSIASTVVLLRGLSDNGLLNTQPGKVAVGWLVLEDLATVAILVVMPALSKGGGSPLQAVFLALLKTGLFAAGMLIIGRRVLPWILTQIAETRSRELFILAVMAASLGTAMLAAQLFGISLALGAFLAGVVIGESEVSQQVAAEALPFQEMFAVVFFVSVGMLVDPMTLWENAGEVLLMSALIVVGKAFTTMLLGIFLPAGPSTILVVAAGLSQIGEFSFIVGQTGLALNMITHEQYSLVLAGALISIVINPFLYRLVEPAERKLKTWPLVWKLLSWRSEAVQEAFEPLPEMSGHVVIVGAGRVGSMLLRVMIRLELPCLLVESDHIRGQKYQEKGVPVLYGDASNSEVLDYANLDKARFIIVTVPNQSACEVIVAAARSISPEVPVLARAGTADGVQRLARLGAREVIHPELEGSMEITRHTLLGLGFSFERVQQFVDSVRREAYHSKDLRGEEILHLSQLLTSIGQLELNWVAVSEESPLAGKALGDAKLRSRTGASAVAMLRGEEIISNPEPEVEIQSGDLIALIGNLDQLSAAEKLLQQEA